MARPKVWGGSAATAGRCDFVLYGLGVFKRLRPLKTSAANWLDPLRLNFVGGRNESFGNAQNRNGREHVQCLRRTTDCGTKPHAARRSTRRYCRDNQFCKVRADQRL
jgi:hypothetical protein